MKAGPPRRQTVVPMAVMGIVVASLFATLPDLGAGSSPSSSTTLEAGTAGAGPADSGPDRCGRDAPVRRRAVPRQAVDNVFDGEWDGGEV